MISNKILEIDEVFKGSIRRNEKISKHTTMEVGGVAALWFIPEDIEDLSKFLKYANRKDLKIVILGNGSNVIVKDKKLDSLFVNLSSPYFKKIYCKDNVIVARAGVGLKELIDYCLSKSLSGLENFTLIPATIGGAVKNNIGVEFNSIKYEFSSIVEDIKLLEIDTLKLKTYKRDDVEFIYHTSDLSNKIILEVSLNLKKSNSDDISSRIKKISEYRKNTQDYSLPSCGCIFKNPPDKNAGRLIQDINLKGMKIGDVMVSLKHANFIVNCRKAKSKDILKLIKMIKSKVLKHYNIKLEEEVEIIG